MSRRTSLVFFAVLIGVMPILAGCADFDADKLDFFHLNEKKKLPGERKELFPGGVPGASNGVPPELVKGYQPPAQTAEAPPEPPKPARPKAAPKPRVAKRAPPQQQQPAQQQQQTQQAPSPWPTQQPQQQQQQTGANAPWPAPQQQTQQTSPWPSAPSPGSFQR